MLDADDIMLNELERKADAGKLMVRFDVRPVRNVLKSDGGQVPIAGMTLERADELRALGSKEVVMADGAKMLSVPAAGRPIFDDVEFIIINIPGDKTQEIHREVRPTDKVEFAKQYQAWKAGQDQETASGTPLEQWPTISRAQVEELRFFKVRTVEQLAELSDSNASRMGPITAIRQKAKDFLEKAKGNAPMEQMRGLLAERDGEVEALKRQVAELAAMAKQQPQLPLAQEKGRK